jgi:HK97 family phage major capsid protein
MKKFALASVASAALIAQPRPRALIGFPRADASDPKALVTALNTAFEEFKATNEQKIAAKVDDVLFTEKLENINNSLSDLEKALDEQAARIAAASLGGTGAVANPEHTDQINAYMRAGAIPTVQAALSEGTDTAGGYIVPIEWDRSITDKLKQISPIRQNSQVINVTGRGFTRVYNDGVVGSGWVGETAARTETTTPGLTTLQFDVGELYANPAITQRLLDDAGFDIAAWLSSEVEGEFAVQENIAFLSGNGTNKPYGILTYVTGAANATRHPFGAIATTTAAGTTAVTSDEVLTLVSTLPSERDADSKFYMSRATLFSIRKLKDGQGNYLWQPNYVAGQPATLAGYPVVEVAGMPAMTTGLVPILFGDMGMTYLVVDRLGTQVLRDPYTNKPFVMFYTTKRVGGGVQNPEYMKALKMA